MKKLLISLAFAATMFHANAQTNFSGTGYYVNFDKKITSDGQCYANLTTDALDGFGGGNVTKVSFTQSNPTNTFITFKATPANIDKNISPFMGDLYYIVGLGGTCKTLRSSLKLIDMTLAVNQKVKISLKSDAIGDTIDFFLTASADGKYPFSTYNFDGSGKYLIKRAITKSLNFEEFTFDYSEAVTTGETVFSAWNLKNSVNGFGVRLRKPNQIVDIQSLEIGSPTITGISEEEIAALGLQFYPNPAENEVNLSYTNQGKNVSFVLVNSNGNTVATSSDNKIFTTDLSAGLYFAKVFVDGEYTMSSKISIK